MRPHEVPIDRARAGASDHIKTAAERAQGLSPPDCSCYDRAVDDLRPLLSWSVGTLATAGLVLLAWKNWSKPRRIVALFLVLVSQWPTFPVEIDRLRTALETRRTISSPTAFELQVAHALNVGATFSLGDHITARVK